MKLVSIVCGLCLVAVLAVSGPALAKNQKVAICHNGKTIVVSENAVGAHLGHGDVLGECRGSAAMPAVTATPARSFVYYPDIHVYGDPTSKRFFYPEGDRWRSVDQLPNHLRIDGARSVTVQLNGEEPWRFHTTVIKQYPAEFRYSYFPNLFLYLSEDGSRCFRFLEGHWKQFDGPPPGISIDGARQVPITVDVERPYLHHDRFVEQYPPDDAAVARFAVCHKGKKTLYLPESAVQAHLNHGDHQEECGRWRGDGKWDDGDEKEKHGKGHGKGKKG